MTAHSPNHSSPEAIALSVRLCQLVGVDPPDEELAYINMEVVARAAAERSGVDPSVLQPIFDVAEEVLETGDRELRTLIAVGLFEDLQNYLMRGLGNAEAIAARLGPRSKHAWTAVEESWEGDPRTLKRALTDD